MTQHHRKPRKKGPATAAELRFRKAALHLLGERIREHRVQRSNQDEAAAASGLARSYYGSVERGRFNVAAVNIFRIALALNVEPAELMPSLAELRKAQG